VRTNEVKEENSEKKGIKNRHKSWIAANYACLGRFVYIMLLLPYYE
jgi:hypothetical protein